jgi:Tol biopolymer transport system component
MAMPRAHVFFVALTTCMALVLAGNSVRGTVPGVNGRIAFGRFDPAADDFHIFTANPDGSDQHQVFAGLAECPTWSPDGRQIQICAFSSGLLRPIIIDANGSNVTTVYVSDPTLNLGCWAWSPQDRLACEGWDEANPSRLPGIFTVGVSGTGLRRVTTNGTGGNDALGDYSPDGSKIVFLRESGPDSELGALFIVNTDGTGLRQLTPEIARDAGSWSPDGDWILFSNFRGRLFAVHADGSQMRGIPMGSKTRVAQPSWSPDGTLIVARVRLSGAAPQLMTFSPDGAGLRPVADTGDLEEFPDWGVITS